MKRFFVLSIILLLLIVIIPFAVMFNSNHRINNTDINFSATTDESSTTLSEEEIDYIACNAMLYIENANNYEAKKALIAVCKNNYLYLCENNITPEELNITNYSDPLLNELSEILNTNTESITYNDESVYIPIEKTSLGYTATDDEYAYMESVASPWDVFHKNFSKDINVNCGISVTGINYLCEKGFDYKDALRWFLPNFTIQ